MNPQEERAARTTLTALLESSELGPTSDPKLLAPLSGGSINRVYRVEMKDGKSLLLKSRPDAPPGFFHAESRGLETLDRAGTLRVPRVYAVSQQGILMEWLTPPPQAGPGERIDQGKMLGAGLASLHLHSAASYGFTEDNFVGLLPQRNRQCHSWIDFYRDERLEPQLKLAHELGRLSVSRAKALTRMLDRLPTWIDQEAVRPSLLHGDLWGGNWLKSDTGPALIDPAVYYGDREVDLAMAHLFGGFPESFFTAYSEAAPLAPGHEERRPLYQLYYLLIHLNLFGEGYTASVENIVAHYGD